MVTKLEDFSGGGCQQQIELPPGFRFHPTDEEVISCYLREKVINRSFSPAAIGEVDLNRCEPWDLPSKAKNFGEKEWYFYCQKDKKYPTGTRTNRATESGYWKATGKDKEIYRGKGDLVGMKKTLVFYKGRAPRGEKTNWVMHEFRIEKKSCYNKVEGDEWVVCRITHKNNEPIKKYDQINVTVSSPSSSSSMAVSFFDNDLRFDSTQAIPPLVEIIHPNSQYPFNRTNPNSTDHWKAYSSSTATTTPNIHHQNPNQFQYSSTENFTFATPFPNFNHPSMVENSYGSTETTPRYSPYFNPQFSIPTIRFIPTPTNTNSSSTLQNITHDRTFTEGFLTSSAQGGETIGSWRCKEEGYSNQSQVTSSPDAVVTKDKNTIISSAFPVPELNRPQSLDDINQPLLPSAASLSEMESPWDYY